MSNDRDDVRLPSQEVQPEDDMVARHAARRRAFLARTATAAPVVGLLLAQSARPASAAVYTTTHAP